MSIDRRPPTPTEAETARLYSGVVELFPEQAVIINRRLGLGFRRNHEGRSRDIVVVRDRGLGLVIEYSKANPIILRPDVERDGFVGRGIDVRGVERIIVGEEQFILTLEKFRGEEGTSLVVKIKSPEPLTRGKIGVIEARNLREEVEKADFKRRLELAEHETDAGAGFS